MNGIPLTHHAQVRTQQRGIAPLIVEWLLHYGATQPSGCGSELHYFTKESRRHLGKLVGEQIVKRLEGLLDAYVVVGSDGAVITAGHRFRRIRRDL